MIKVTAVSIRSRPGDITRFQQYEFSTTENSYIIFLNSLKGLQS